ncbi:hypothetical protein GIB67_001050 [Kingdonia uniflora]|uniref:WEB family protein n=1 Tax=Kingdonia uniflora TaxID=39325 RepID=A0A7J7MG26_9MAGN|nr:hypothetical protein GIB67_001050 [Kingdonia uniflora]
MVVKAHQRFTDSSKAQVGEIDTKAPFESVKAAVSLFGAVRAFSGAKPVVKKSKPPSEERVLDKESQLHLAQKELSKYMVQLKIAETVRAQALSELEKAKRTVEDLTNKLKVINESKQLALNTTEAAKNQTKQLGLSDHYGCGGVWKQELDSAREQYTDAITKLDETKQELTNILQDFEASMVTKTTSLKQAEEAVHLTKVNMERAGELSKGIKAAQEELTHAKLASVQANEDRAQMLSEKDVQRQSYKAALKELESQLATSKKELDPDLTANIQADLTKTEGEIQVLQKEITNAKASDENYVKNISLELDDAKGVSLKFPEEERDLQNLMELLKLELENMKKEHFELKEKEAEFESIASNLNVNLLKGKLELEMALAEVENTRGAYEELNTTLQHLTMDSELVAQETEEMKKDTEVLKEEAGTLKVSLEESEKMLLLRLKEVEEAKAAEVEALGKMKHFSERTKATHALASETGGKITISITELKYLKRKVEEFNGLAEMKVAAASAKVIALKASENETLKKTERNQKIIKVMEVATEESLKRAETADKAKGAIEGELRKWRERELQCEADTQIQILAEIEESPESPPRRSSVQKMFLMKTKSYSKLEKKFGSGKTILPTLSGIFRRKKGLIESGSPPHVPGDLLL